MLIDTSEGYKVDYVGMVDIIDMVETMNVVDNLNIVDSKYNVNVQKTFGFFKLLVDYSGWTS